MGKSRTIRLTTDKIKVILNLFEHINGRGSSNSLDIKVFVTNKNSLSALAVASREYLIALDIKLKNEIRNETEFNEVKNLITIVSADLKLVENILKYDEILVN